MGYQYCTEPRLPSRGSQANGARRRLQPLRQKGCNWRRGPHGGPVGRTKRGTNYAFQTQTCDFRCQVFARWNKACRRRWQLKYCGLARRDRRAHPRSALHSRMLIVVDFILSRLNPDRIWRCGSVRACLGYLLRTAGGRVRGTRGRCACLLLVTMRAINRVRKPRQEYSSLGYPRTNVADMHFRARRG